MKIYKLGEMEGCFADDISGKGIFDGLFGELCRRFSRLIALTFLKLG